ncbi:MAG: lysophospholipid acyltransferase family protein [Flavobacteriaceae bacterium]
MLKRNPFGHYLFIKRWLIRLLGIITRRRFNGFNDLHIRGSSIIRDLPEKNVLFISNHQTYFADVTAMFHVFFASLAGRDDNLNYLRYIWRPKLNVYYIAAKETMKSGLLPRILAYTGSISIERTWREKGKSINRQVKMSDITNIGKALDDGWVITFPQGTTKPFAPVRKGTLHIIKTYNPIVVPIVIDGFRRSFDKKGIFIKKKGIKQSMHIKKPMVFDLNKSNEDLVKQIAEAIEQVPKK